MYRINRIYMIVRHLGSPAGKTLFVAAGIE
jgi:hypothetical protein